MLLVTSLLSLVAAVIGCYYAYKANIVMAFVFAIIGLALIVIGGVVN